MTLLHHRQVLAQISPTRMAVFTQRKDTPGLLHLAGHVALIATSGSWIVFGLPFWPVAIVIHGIFLTFLFTLEHETTHQTPFASATLNETVGHACALILILPFTWFRYFHLAHHRHTNDPEKDPELLNGHKPDTWPDYLWHLTGARYWYGMAKIVVKNALGHLDADYLPARAKPRMILEARIMLFVYLLAAIGLTQTTALLWLWVIPMIVGQPFLRLYLLAEHSRCAAVANMFANTRTTFTNSFVRFVAWNMPYHAEHHAAPQVPFHQLPALHEDVAQHLHETAQSYTSFSRDYASRLS